MSSVELRADHRLPNQLRALAAEPGALSRADGSARFSHDRTTVLAAVWGPGEVRRTRERPDRATLEVLVRPVAGLPGPAEREMEQLLTATLSHVILLSLHPRTLLSIVVQPVHDDGSLLAAALHACCVALMHAGVPLRGMLGSCAAAITPEGGVLLDPSRAEEQAARAVVTLAHLVRSGPGGEQGGEQGDEPAAGAEPAARGLLLSHATGAVAQRDYEAALASSRQAAEATAAFCRNAMLAGRQPRAPPILALGRLAPAEVAA